MSVMYEERRVMKYCEIGYGNSSFVSTEIENENRLSRRVAGEIMSCYFRVWIGKKIFILDSVEGIKTGKKERNCFKVLFGVVLK
jgi:hypothetical protein